MEDLVFNDNDEKINMILTIRVKRLEVISVESGKLNLKKYIE